MISPAAGSLRMARSDSTATGRANCSPRNPLTKRPPRISPRSSRRRKAISKLAPLRQVGFAREQLAEDDAVALRAASSRWPRRALVAVEPIGWIEQRPASGAVPRTRVRAAALSGAALGIDERAQIVEAVGGDQAGGHQFPQARSRLRLSACRCRARCRRRKTRRAGAGSRAPARAPWLSRALRGLLGVRAMRGCIQSDSSRTKKVMGATLVGITRRLPSAESSSVAGCGDRRPQPTAPVRQS